jgi:hypothetical protein
MERGPSVAGVPVAGVLSAKLMAGNALVPIRAAPAATKERREIITATFYILW